MTEEKTDIIVLLSDLMIAEIETIENPILKQTAKKRYNIALNSIKKGALDMQKTLSDLDAKMALKPNKSESINTFRTNVDDLNLLISVGIESANKGIFERLKQVLISFKMNNL